MNKFNTFKELCNYVESEYNNEDINNLIKSYYHFKLDTINNDYDIPELVAIEEREREVINAIGELDTKLELGNLIEKINLTILRLQHDLIYFDLVHQKIEENKKKINEYFNNLN